MKHRLYKLESKFTILGMSAVDWGVILGTFIFSTQVLGIFAPPRLKLFLCLFIVALVYWGWYLLKDKIPDKFAEHFIIWLGEPEVYRCVPDTDNVPLVVDHAQVRPRNTGRFAHWSQGGKRRGHTLDPLGEEVRPRGTISYEG